MDGGKLHYDRPRPVKQGIGHACICWIARPGTGTNLTTSLTSIKERTQRATYILLHTHTIQVS